MINDTMVTATAIPDLANTGGDPYGRNHPKPARRGEALHRQASRKITPAPMNPIPAAT